MITTIIRELNFWNYERSIREPQSAILNVSGPALGKFNHNVLYLTFSFERLLRLNLQPVS
ncbi:MAG: hypothetical protein QOH71_556 [Blastocatellia bacterium]|nr:hypothetical protein [Blastocatellia bacterium]